MKVAFFFLGLLALAAAEHVHHPHVVKKLADKLFLERQKAIIELLWGVTQPVSCPKIIEIANTYRIEENFDLYDKVDMVRRFVNGFKTRVVFKETVFSPVNENHLEEAMELFYVFLFAQTFEAFYKSACWARVHANAGLFVYAFTGAVFHRKDCNGMVVPAPYEIFPHLFVDSQVIQEAYHVKFGKPFGTDGNREPVVITVNDTRFYPYYQHDYNKHDPERWVYHNDVDLDGDSENRLFYFTEDVAINTYNYYRHLFNPSYLIAVDEYKPEGHGELFLYYIEQLVARYFMERLSNDLPDMGVVFFGIPIRHGYNPNLRYPNGKPFSSRRQDSVLYGHFPLGNREIEDYVRRISDAIDLGYVITNEGENVTLLQSSGLDILGHVIEGSEHSVNSLFYGKLFELIMNSFGRISNERKYRDIAPSVLEHYETALRDPLFYQLADFFVYLTDRYNQRLDEYTYEELLFPGVKVNSVEVDELVTFFENFEFDISSAVAGGKIDEDLVVKVRQYRLNHKPFTYKINVTSDKEDNVMVRVFIGPKYDVEGHIFGVNMRRGYMVEIDRFPHEVMEGENIISRNSRDIYSAIEDHISIRDLYKQVVDALEGKSKFYYEEVDRHCGFPNRFLLPKGKREGLPLTFFVVVRPLIGNVDAPTFDTEYRSTVGCGTGLGLLPQDGYAMGYPFNRGIEPLNFNVPNFFEKEVVVFHKAASEVANGSN